MHSPSSVLRLDPAYPLLWQDESTVQFGADALVTVALDEEWVEKLLMALRSGIRPASFAVVCFDLGAPEAAARALLQTLGPVLHKERMQYPAIELVMPEPFPVRAEALVTEVFRDAEVAVGPAASADRDDTVALMLLYGVAPAALCTPFMADDRAHLPVSFDEAGVSVGPLVRPGETPCLTCRDEHDRARSPHWARIHAQLLGRGPVAIPVHRAVAAARAALRLLVGQPGRAVRITDDGVHVWRTVQFHAECLCQSPSESVRPAGRVLQLVPPMTASESVQIA